MAYSTVVHYFESNQVTKFSLDLNTGVITMTLKEGAQELPNAAEQSTTQSTGGLLSGLLSSSSSAPTGVKKNDDGTETVSYKLPYARMFVDHVSDYIAQYDAANPGAPMVYDYVPAKETIPWMEILFYLAMLGCTGFLLFSMMRGGAGGGGIMNVGKAKVKDEHENKKTATFADVAGEDEEKEELPTPSPEIIYVTPVPTTVPMPTAVPAVPDKAGSSDRMTAVLALGAILLLGGAGAFVLVKYRRNSARHRADNDFMLDDDDESAE